MPLWLTFLLSAGLVIVAGARLAYDGETIAEGTGLGSMWIGAILVAAATSLPELLTDANAVLQGHPGLAVGDLFGSNMANMLILAVADICTRQPRLLTRVAINQALVGILAICLALLAGVGVAARDGSLLGLGWAALAVAFTYVAGMRVIFYNRPEPPFRTEAEVAEAKPSRLALRRAILGFTAAALVLLIAAPALARSTAGLADQLGISLGFAGMLLLAITTSLPEAAVSVAGIRSGSYNLVVGNLLGSNCFNMAALVPLDIIDGPGSILAKVDPSLTIGAFAGAILMTLGLIDVLNKSERRIWMIEPGPAFMVLGYFAGLYLSFRAGG